jgi:hypothetical protein
MATVSSAGSGSAMSNLNRGTRNMSASDWTRLKRLGGAKGYSAMVQGVTPGAGDASSTIYNRNKDIGVAPEGPQQPRNQSLLIPYEGAGTHRILRPASNWTDFVASQTADYIITDLAAVNTTSVIQMRNTVCNPNTTTTIQKAVNPAVNQVNRMKIIS